MTDDEERDISLKRTPGAIDTLDEKDRERVKNAHDPQLDRATDLLKGILLFAERAPEKKSRPSKTAAVQAESEK